MLVVPEERQQLRRVRLREVEALDERRVQVNGKMADQMARCQIQIAAMKIAFHSEA